MAAGNNRGWRRCLQGQAGRRLLVGLLALVAGACGTDVQRSAPPGTSRTTQSTVGFRSRQQLDEHFAKHGAEFGGIDKARYLRLAQELRDAPAGGDILQIVRGDGTVSRFDRVSGAFIAFDGDGTIRTFFKPNDAERYFQRQAERSH